MGKKKFFDSLKTDMKVAQKILRFCQEHRAEFHPGRKGYTIVVPRLLGKTLEEELRCLVPEGAEVDFIEAPKEMTRNNLMNLLRRVQPSSLKVEPDMEGRTIVIEANGVPESDPVWGEMSQVLRKDGYFESWKYVIEGNEVKVFPDVMDAMSSRKGRDTAINEGDITDLKISLSNAQTVDDILKAMGGA